jgi:5-methylcytosine-specific restriction enzyme subunit McrC
VSLDRNTQRYQKALQLARLIILNYSPDLRAGYDNVLAILFDMNRLFERFILVHCRRSQRHGTTERFRFKAQASERFWASKTIRPDIVIDLPGQIGRGSFDRGHQVENSYRRPAVR